MSSEATLLVIDDEPTVLATVDRFAQDFGFTVASRTNARAALVELPVLRPDAVMVDLHMPDINGLDVLRAIRDIDPTCQIILMTGQSSVDTAIEAVKLGALDYISKPFDLQRLGGLLTGVRKSIERRERLLQADAEVAKTFAFCGMIGRSPAMQELFDAVRRFAPHVRTLLVTGETGTGKELVAHALHTLGARPDRRFVTVNCSAVVEALFESELFGHQRGAFTGATETKVGLFEHADKGTLFLDEIGELPLPIQAKLLRAVEYGDVQRVGSLDAKQVDVTVIAATNRDLRADAANGRFRSDLYYRLSVMEIRLVPLRERREDIPYLSAVFLREVTGRLRRPLIGMTAAAERTLLQAPWPGNVRELRNVIERACLLSDGKMLSERDVLAAMPPSIDTPMPAMLTESAPDASASTWDPAFLTNAQRSQVEHALREAGGNKAAAARLLGISRRSMFRWVKRLDLSQPTVIQKETSRLTKNMSVIDGARVLVVDDDPSVSRLLERLLTTEGYSVCVAVDAASALEAVASHNPDVILLDVVFPGGDGFALCQTLKRDAATRLTPVILVTGLTDRESRIKGRQAGADDFLTKPVDAQELLARVGSVARVKRYTDDLESAASVITTLTVMIETRDGYTEGHCHRMANYAAAVGRTLGLGNSDLQALHRGGFLHDIGMLAIPTAVLQKPGPLEPEEFALVKSHTVLGDDLCRNLRSLQAVRPIVRHHHERLDGSGYPDGLQGTEVPLLAQIIGVVDVYDAVTSLRPYQPVQSANDAVQLLREEVRRGWRQRQIVDAFEGIIRHGRLETFALLGISRRSMFRWVKRLNLPTNRSYRKTLRRHLERCVTA